jgi:plastocyanin
MRRAASSAFVFLLGLVVAGSGCGGGDEATSPMLGESGESGAGAGGTRNAGEAGAASGSGENVAGHSGNSGEGGAVACRTGCDDVGGRGGDDAGAGGAQQLGGRGGDDAGTAGTPPTGASGAEAAGAGGQAGEGDSVGGSGPTEPEIVNGCFSFVDETDVNALRTIDWSVTVASNPARCQRILPGQTVTWRGSLDSHPIQPSGGTHPTPITGDTPSGATSYQVTFPDIGVYGYECGLHAGMRGAIEVR